MKKLMEKFKKLSKKQIIIISSILVVVTLSVVTGVVLLTKGKEDKEEQQTCVVQFETGGGNLLAPVSTPCGSKIEKPEEPIKEGFDFINWYLLDSEFNFDSKIESDIVLTAKWEAQEGVEVVTIHFDTDGGSEIADIEIVKGSTMNMPISPSKVGYVFVSWYYNDEPFSFGTEINEDITLKATWQKLEIGSSYIPSTNPGAGSSVVTSGKCQYILNNSPSSFYEMSQSPSSWGKYMVSYTLAFNPWSSYSGGCGFRYKSSNPSVAPIDDDGYIHENGPGTAIITICIYEKETNKDLKCFDGTVKLSEAIVIEHPEITIPFNQISGKWYAKYSNISYVDISEYPSHKDYITYMFYNIRKNTFDYSCKTGTCSTDRNLYDFDGYSFGEGAVYLGSFEKEFNVRLENNVLYLTKSGKTIDFYRTPFDVPVSSISISADDNKLRITDYMRIHAYVNPFHATQPKVKWTNSNPSVAEIIDENSGSNREKGYHSVITVRGVSNGTTTFTATTQDGKFSKSFTLTVYGGHVPIPVESVTLNQTNLNLKREETYKLTATINPSNADNKNVSWSSSNPSVATVSNGTVKAVGKGTAIITATTFDGNKTASATVNVTNPPLEVNAGAGWKNTCSNVSSCGSYDFAYVIPSGGSGVYTISYKVYKDGTYLGTYTDQETYFPRQGGVYKVEYTVTDSDGNRKSGAPEITIG